MRQALADHDFNERILRGVERVLTDVDVVRARDLQLSRADDGRLLEVSAEMGRVFLTHDARTMPPTILDRVGRSLVVPPVVLCPQQLAIGRAIEDLTILFGASRDDDEWASLTWLPL